MTVKEKITQLNREVQMMYYETKDGLVDGVFFHHTFPDKIKEIKSFIEKWSSKDELKELQAKALWFVDKQLDDVLKVNNSYSFHIKDPFIITAKKSVSQACDYFINLGGSNINSIIKQDD